MTTNFYSLYSQVASVSAWPELLQAIHARLQPFAAAPAATTDLLLSFEALAAGHSLPRPTGRRVYDFTDGSVSYDDDRDLLTIVAGERVSAVCEPAAGRVRVCVESPDASDLYLLSHPVLSLVLMELLKRRGLFPLHAAGLALDGRGVLLAGTSGAGKSTLSVALAKRGFSFLSDDTVYLEPTAQGCRVRAFPDQVDLCADAPELFPELRDVAGSELPPGWKKRQIRTESVYGTAISWDATPGALVFPRVSGAAKSVLTPMSQDEALFELAPNVLLTDARGSQQHLNALAGLVSQCACYRLATGRDLDDAVDVVRQAVA